MKVEIKGDKLIITMELQTMRASKSGKTWIVASTGGFQPTSAQVDGKDISVSVNATIKK